MIYYDMDVQRLNNTVNYYVTTENNVTLRRYNIMYTKYYFPIYICIVTYSIIYYNIKSE